MPVAPHPSAPLSVLPGVVWPGLPNAAGQRMLAVQFQFTQSETWLPQQMRQVQFMQLAQLLQHARSTVPFYRDRLPELRGGVIDPAAFAQIPLLRRQDIQDHYEQLQSRAVPPDHGAPMEAQTSGSTGRPIRFLSTELIRALWQAFTLREHLWHGREFAGKLAAIRGPSRIKPGTIAGWGPATGDLFRTGPGVTYSTEQSMAAQAEWLMHENPEYLISISSNARELA
jgi:phenylacetate-CoA ligase